MDVFAVILLSFSLVDGFDYNRRCLLLKDACVARCPRDMHPYHTRCDKDTVSQRTCTSLYIHSIGYTCGWSRCDCNGDLFLDEDSDLCVPLESCPPAKIRKPSSRRKKKPYKVPKDVGVRIIDDGDLIDI